MIRSELCAIADMSPSTFNSHRRNGDLPFEMTTREAKDGTGRTWSRFEIHDAALLIAARNLVATQGVTWSEAARMLRHREKIFVGPMRFALENGEPIFVAKVTFSNVRTGEAPLLLREGTSIYQGPLAEIVASAGSTVAIYNEKISRGAEQIEILSVAAVNLSHCYRIAIKAADMLNIDLTIDGAPEQGGDE